MKYYIVRILAALFIMGSIPGGLLAGTEYGMLFGWITFIVLAALGIILHKRAKEIEQSSRKDSIDMNINKTWGIVTLCFWSPMLLFYFAYPPSAWRMLGWLPYASVFAVLAGIASGVLLLVYPRIGKILAVLLSAILLVVKFWQIISAYPHIGERLYANYILFMNVKPIHVIYNDILGFIFFISTIYVFIIRNKQID